MRSWFANPSALHLLWLLPALTVIAALAWRRRQRALARLGPLTAVRALASRGRAGDPALARDVGQALGANPIPIIVPCHRVLAAGGRAGGFSAPGGVMTKLKLLEIERRRIPFELT